MKRIVINDAEELSHALKHTNVSAMQINKGRFIGELSQYAVDDWSLQHVGFLEGRSSCRGNSPAKLHALVVPMSQARDFRLLGREVTPSSFGLYAPNSEHADTTAAGASEIVLVPPAGMIEWLDDQLKLDLPRAGSHHRHAAPRNLAQLRAVLDDLHLAFCTDLTVLGQSAVARNFTDRLQSALYSLLPTVEAREERGRPELPRPQILRRLYDRLDNILDEPIYASELCREFAISFPTLRRIFINWFGMPPAKYLLLRRYYVARQRLKSDRFDSVASVAHSCGFWDQSRFAMNYRRLFSETPSMTRRRRFENASSERGR